jgi:hypothetical protein
MCWMDWRLFPPQEELQIARPRNRRRNPTYRRQREAPSRLKPLRLFSVNNIRSERLYGMVTRYMCLAIYGELAAIYTVGKAIRGTSASPSEVGSNARDAASLLLGLTPE